MGFFGGGFGVWCRRGPHSWRPGKQARRRCRVPGTGEDPAIGGQGRNGRYSQNLHFPSFGSIVVRSVKSPPAARPPLAANYDNDVSKNLARVSLDNVGTAEPLPRPIG